MHYGQVYLLPTGRFDEAIAEIKRALELEPQNIPMMGNLAAAYFFAGQNDKAMEEARIIYDLEPGYVLWRLYLSQAYIEKGMYAEAVEISEQWLQSAPDEPMGPSECGNCLCEGRPARQGGGNDQ